LIGCGDGGGVDGNPADSKIAVVPTELTAVANSSSKITIRWKNQGDYINYVIYYDTKTPVTKNSSSYSTLSNITNIEFTGFSPNTKYYFAVSATKNLAISSNETDLSQEVSATTLSN